MKKLLLVSLITLAAPLVLEARKKECKPKKECPKEPRGKKCQSKKDHGNKCHDGKKSCK